MSKVVAASFVDPSLMMQLIAVIGGTNDRLDKLNTHMGRAEAHQHDEKIARDAAKWAALKALIDRDIR